MHINNEIGVVNDIESIGKITREAGNISCGCCSKYGQAHRLINLEVDLMSFCSQDLWT